MIFFCRKRIYSNIYCADNRKRWMKIIADLIGIVILTGFFGVTVEGLVQELGDLEQW